MAIVFVPDHSDPKTVVFTCHQPKAMSVSGRERRLLRDSNKSGIGHSGRASRVLKASLMIASGTREAVGQLGQSPRRRPDLLVHKRLHCLGDKGGEFLVNRELAAGQFKGLNVRKTE